MRTYDKECTNCNRAFTTNAYRKATCSPRCQYQISRRKQYGTKEEQFWSKVNKADDCWEWTGTIMRDGYGRFSIDRRYRLAHRVSYEMHFGAIPHDLCVLHRCDNRRCVRPDHLFLGTQKDNAQDALSKGRFTTGERNGWRKAKKRHKLTDAQVGEIIERYRRGGVTHKELAIEYGVNRSMISMIIGGRRRLLGRS